MLKLSRIDFYRKQDAETNTLQATHLFLQTAIGKNQPLEIRNRNRSKYIRQYYHMPLLYIKGILIDNFF